jgi:threonine synthase
MPHIHAVQAAGSAPVVRAFQAGLDFPEPVKPDTIAKSIAIGNPADGHHVLETLRATGGSATMVEDRTILETIQLLAETEGVFTEPAGGATLAGAIALIKNGTIPADESIAVCITGNGYKTADVLNGHTVSPIHLGKALSEFEDYLKGAVGTATST